MISVKRRLLHGVLFIAFALLAWALVVEPSRLVVRRETIAGTGLPPRRVALIADLHAGARFIDRDKIHRLVDLVNAESPDLILLLGDYLNNGRGAQPAFKGGPLAPEEVTHELGRLRARDGVFAVLGNHDWWFDGERLTTALTAAGITVLENSAARAGDLWLVGLADATTRVPDAGRALTGVPDGAPVVALTHNPDVFPQIPPRIALTVAGHTHGGQVSLPWVGRPIVPSRFGARFAAGLVEEGGHRLFVTTGVGTSIYPVRFGVPPEVAILTW
jgi:predicted MPP superfamily phosphohydrolase